MLSERACLHKAIKKRKNNHRNSEPSMTGNGREKFRY